MLVQLIDQSVSPDYLDEFTGTLKSLSDGSQAVQLRSMVDTRQSSDEALNVTPLTELAVRLASHAGEGVWSDDLLQFNDLVAASFGLTSITQTPIAFTNTSDFQPANGLNGAEDYGLVLAIFSAWDSESGSVANTLDWVTQHLEISKTGEYWALQMDSALAKRVEQTTTLLSQHLSLDSDCGNELNDAAATQLDEFGEINQEFEVLAADTGSVEQFSVCATGTSDSSVTTTAGGTLHVLNFQYTPTLVPATSTIETVHG
jgi:hypothetical protein